VSADKLSVNADFRWCLNAKLVYDERSREEKKSHEKHWKLIFASWGFWPIIFPLNSSSSSKFQLRVENLCFAKPFFISDLWFWRPQGRLTMKKLMKTDEKILGKTECCWFPHVTSVRVGEISSVYLVIS
jgi:hypothetical protein